MKAILTRWRFRWLNFMAGADAMSRRVDVERYLFDCAAGKRPLPDSDKCRELAQRLGVETRHWPWTSINL